MFNDLWMVIEVLLILKHKTSFNKAYRLPCQMNNELETAETQKPIVAVVVVVVVESLHCLLVMVVVLALL